MNVYKQLVIWFADEDAFSCVLASVLVLGTAFTAFLSLSRVNVYKGTPDVEGFKTVQSAVKLMGTFSLLLWFWILLAIYYWLAFNHPGGIGIIYKALSFSAVSASVFAAIVKHKYSNAKKIYNALYLKANRGNLSALMGNPLGLNSDQQEALGSILNKSVNKTGGGYSHDPLNDILSGRKEIKPDKPTAAMETVEEYLKGSEEQTRQCPFCKGIVDKKYPICIYCGRPIPNRDNRVKPAPENQSDKERNNV